MQEKAKKSTQRMLSASPQVNSRRAQKNRAQDTEIAANMRQK